MDFYINHDGCNCNTVISDHFAIENHDKVYVIMICFMRIAFL